LALGSPKFDAVINKKREDFTLPEEWEKLINSRKVVFYNTSLGAILQGGERYLPKLRSVIETLKKCDDVVLWWRPHPLSVSTFETMRPQLAYEYKEIVSDYKASGFGVYDDTADLHRAIAWSDAYYGDASSVVALYEVTGKPSVYQNIDVRLDNENDIIFLNLHDDGENIWFTPLSFNSLFRINKQTWETKHIGTFPNEKMNGFALYGKIEKYEGKLYFSPHKANEIAVYDIKLNKFGKINIDRPNITNKNDYTSKFWFSATYEEYVFFVPTEYPAIIRYNSETGELDYFSDWIKKIEQLKDSGKLYFSKGCVLGEDLFLPCTNANAVVVFNLKKCVSKVYKVGDAKYSYKNMCHDGNNFWILPRTNTPVIKWNPDLNIYKEYNNFPNGFVDGDFNFVGINYLNGFIWLFPYNANMSLKINIEDDSIMIADEFQNECYLHEGHLSNINYRFSTTIENKIYSLSGKTNQFIEYNGETEQVCIRKIKFVHENLNIIYKKLLSNNTLNENAFLELQSFLNYIVNNLQESDINNSQNKINNDKLYGTKIYEYVKSKIKDL
jgi:hypothetical protein